MPKGVDFVPTTVMPKGVEHTVRTGRIATSSGVPTTVMPKGVEHAAGHEGEKGHRGVPTTVMPKGVEHIRAEPKRPRRRPCRPQ